MTAASTSEPLTVLIVEDDDGHATLVRSHLQQAGVTSPIVRFRDGDDAWNVLARIGPEPHRRAGAAYVMLLDIRMPRRDGVTLLTKLKSSAELKALPVIMLTTTDDPRDIQECYRIGCNGYLIKSLNFREFAESLGRLGRYLRLIQVSPLD